MKFGAVKLYCMFPKIYAGTTDLVGQYKGESMVLWTSSKQINLKK